MRGRRMERDNDAMTMTPEQSRYNSSTRDSLQYNYAASATADSQSVSILKESSPRRTMGQLLESSAAWKGSYTDRSVLSDRAVMTSLSRAQADIERNRNYGPSSSSAAHTLSSNALHLPTHTEKEILDLKDTNIYSVMPINARTVDFQGTEVRRSPTPTLYFRSQVSNFGMTAVGTNSRLKVELCNASADEVGTLTALSSVT